MKDYLDIMISTHTNSVKTDGAPLKSAVEPLEG